MPIANSGSVPGSGSGTERYPRNKLKFETTLKTRIKIVMTSLIKNSNFTHLKLQKLHIFRSDGAFPAELQVVFLKKLLFKIALRSGSLTPN